MTFFLKCLCIGSLAILVGCASGLRVDHSHAAVAQDSRVRYSSRPGLLSERVL